MSSMKERMCAARIKQKESMSIKLTEDLTGRRWLRQGHETVQLLLLMLLMVLMLSFEVNLSHSTFECYFIIVRYIRPPQGPSVDPTLFPLPAGELHR